MAENDNIAGNNQNSGDDNTNDASQSIEQNQGDTSVTNGEQGGDGQQNEPEWKPGDPFHKHPDWIKRETELREVKTQLEQLSKSQQTQTDASSSNQQDPEYDTSSREAFYESLNKKLPDLVIPEVEVDPKTGDVIKQPFNTYKDMFLTFEKMMYTRNKMRDSMEQQYWNDQDTKNVNAYTNDVNRIKKEINDKDGVDSFTQYVDDAYNKENLNTDINTLYTLWKKSYKPKSPVDKNLQGAARVNNGNSQVSSDNNSGTRNKTVIGSSWDDLQV